MRASLTTRVNQTFKCYYIPSQEYIQFTTFIVTGVSQEGFKPQFTEYSLLLNENTDTLANQAATTRLKAMYASSCGYP